MSSTIEHINTAIAWIIAIYGVFAPIPRWLWIALLIYPIVLGAAFGILYQSFAEACWMAGEALAIAGFVALVQIIVRSTRWLLRRRSQKT